MDLASHLRSQTPTAVNCACTSCDVLYTQYLYTQIACNFELIIYCLGAVQCRRKSLVHFPFLSGVCSLHSDMGNEPVWMMWVLCQFLDFLLQTKNIHLSRLENGVHAQMGADSCGKDRYTDTDR